MNSEETGSRAITPKTVLSDESDSLLRPSLEYVKDDSNNDNENKDVDDNEIKIEDGIGQEVKPVKKSNWRDLIAFFICGLLNNYSYVIMLSAAEDLVKGLTGVVLLADIIPTLVLKVLAPFFLHLIPFNIRVTVAVALAIGSFLMVAWSEVIALRLVGVVLASISSGGGEITFLAMSSYYHKNTVSAWSSGTGGAGIAGSLSYLALKGWFNLTPKVALSIISPLPLIMLFATFFLMTGAHYSAGFCSRGKGIAKQKDSTVTELTAREKIRMIPTLLKYMIPLTVVYYAEYSINQGIFPNLKFRKELIPMEDDYVYYQFLYQAGVFISRSSVNIFPIKRLWVPAVLQCCLFIFFFLDAYFRFVPVIFFTFCLILFEGLLGGGTYVNTYMCITKEMGPREREFTLSTVSMSDALGISAAGLTSVFLEPWLREHQSKRLGY
ncbi:hypothetical protein ABK040_006895 [Willaertia magna]